MKGVSATLACGFLFVLAGCAGVPEIPYDRTTAKVQVIGLPTPVFSPDASVALASDPGQSFGLVGALVDLSLQAQRDKEFRQAISGEHFSASDEFKGALVADLEKNGYTVVPIPVVRDQVDLLPKLPESPRPVDAFLDVAVYGYGYVAAGIGSETPYRPYLTLRCKLTRASDGAVLMQDAVMLNNPFPSNLKAVSLAPMPEYQFVTMTDLKADPRRSVEGLRKSIAQVASSVASLMK